MTPLIIAGTILLFALTVGFVLYPVLRVDSTAKHYLRSSGSGDRLAELLALRDAVYEAIRDAEFDRETGKLTAEDYQLMRERLTAEGVRLLQELDRLMQSDVREELEQEIEAEVVELRGRLARGHSGPVPEHDVARTDGPAAGGVRAAIPDAADGQLVRCPTCGNRVRASAQFCTHCGTSLALTCPNCSAHVRSEDRFCSRCGTALSPVSEDVELGQTGS
jgi:hypothetical protein